ncbi:hypothetical protein ES703_69931 [subsurface metagenome]
MQHRILEGVYYESSPGNLRLNYNTVRCNLVPRLCSIDNRPGQSETRKGQRRLRHHRLQRHTHSALVWLPRARPRPAGTKESKSRPAKQTRKNRHRPIRCNRPIRRHQPFTMELFRLENRKPRAYRRLRRAHDQTALRRLPVAHRMAGP